MIQEFRIHATECLLKRTPWKTSYPKKNMANWLNPQHPGSPSNRTRQNLAAGPKNSPTCRVKHRKIVSEGFENFAQHLQCFKAHSLTSFGKFELHEAWNPGCFMTEPGILQIHGWWNLEIYLRVGNLTHLWPCNVGFHFLIGHPNLNLHLPRPDIGRFFCSPILPAKPLTTSLSYDHSWNLCEKENNTKTQAIFPPAFCPAGT